VPSIRGKVPSGAPRNGWPETRPYRWGGGPPPLPLPAPEPEPEPEPEQLPPLPATRRRRCGYLTIAPGHATTCGTPPGPDPDHD
jgi:hypothetical protein